MHEMYAVTALPADKIKNQWTLDAADRIVTIREGLIQPLTL